MNAGPTTTTGARLVTATTSDGRAAVGLVDDDAPALRPLVIDLRDVRRLSPKDDLPRALGLGRGVRTVVDATAGLGRDALALAALGFDVVAVERNPLVQALWWDAIARDGLPPRLRFVADDAGAYLRRIAGDALAPDAVFLDPMFPQDARRALQQRELRLLRAAVGDDDDVDALFDAARAAAALRVVVKRPRKAPPVAEGAAHRWIGASTRLDMYLRG